ncbi:MAG TPA: hypothetical protein PKX32_07455 [Candidatus Saccharicenans sp.]|nr:hypothetical protein [Candidatus Saccharicenans sp.]
MNHYTTVTAEGIIKGVSKTTLVDLNEILDGTGLDASFSNVSTKHGQDYGDLYISGEEHFDEELFIERGAPEFIGRILKKKKIPHLDFGVAFTGSKAAPESAGGTEFRIYADGHMAYAEQSYPDYPPKKPKKQKVWVIKIFCRDDSFATVDGAYSTKRAAKKAMARYADAEYARENGTTFYDEDEMTLVELVVD